MEMPKPTEEHKKLVSLLAGRFSGVETIYPSPWDPHGGTARATVDSRVACDGFCVVTEYVEKRDGRVSYVGHGVTGYDARNRRYLQHWSDSVSGMPPEAKPGVFDGDTLTFHGAGPAGRMRYVYRFTEPNAYEFKIEVSGDGVSWAPFLEARYKRSSKASKGKKKGGGGKKGKRKRK